MRIAYLSAPGRGRTDILLAETVARLEARGYPLAGSVATDLARIGRRDCEMRLRILPDGPKVAVSQVLGEGSRGCRLDGGAVETVAQEAGRRLDGALALVVNKFGKLEAQGRGFVPVMVAALDRGLPVLVGVNGLNLPDFLRFSGGLAEALPPSASYAADWVLSGLLQAA